MYLLIFDLFVLSSIVTNKILIVKKKIFLPYWGLWRMRMDVFVLACSDVGMVGNPATRSAAAALRSQPLGHWLIGHLPVLLGEQNVVC